jgi:prefoldin alpha subunit
MGTESQELSHLTNSFTQLKAALAKFSACIDNVKEISPENQGATSYWRR